MNVPREKIAQALFSLLANQQTGVNSNIPESLQQVARIQKFFRRGKMFSNIPPGELPVLVLLHLAEEAAEPQAFGLQQWTLRFHAVVLLRADAGRDTEVDTVCNAILDAVDATLAAGEPGSYGQQTLGGLVQNAWIEGMLTIEQETIQQPIAISIPIRCLTGQ